MELLNDISIIRPNDPTLIWVKTAISMMSKELLVQQFTESIIVYEDKILKKDESFFLDELHKELDADSFAAKELSKIRSIWNDPSTTKDTKECIWKYFILLLKLGKKITSS
jgi:hypothetical protein